MPILDWNSLDAAGRRAALARPEVRSREDVNRIARELIERVRREGDAALRELTARFDGAKSASLAVSKAEFEEARRAVTPEQVAALERAIANVQRFHQAQAPKPLLLEMQPGVRCEQVIRPIASVGLYVPAGTAALPSSVIMLGVPALVAGVPKRVLCTPPRPDGRANPSVLVAAELCGIERVFKVGGAHAIAAMAYGTESIPKVDKIFGPGSGWVTAAKQIVANDPEAATCDLPAGPSEVLVVADETARASFVASDLLAQAEHDTQAQGILVTNRRSLAEEVAAEVHLQRAELTRKAILGQSLDSCRAILVSDLEAAFSVVNAYAPEHLILQIRKPREWLARLESAGSVFIGPWSPEPIGDYCSGPNHVLPTFGAARTVSGLSVRDFVKTIAVQELSPAGLRALAPTAVTLAKLEGLDAHANAIQRRLEVLDAARADAESREPAPGTSSGGGPVSSQAKAAP
jgi:histidinol dehydrogenase